MQNIFLSKRTLIVVFLTIVFFTQKVQAQIIYVNNASTGVVTDGASWATAFTNLNAALTAAVSGNAIWVAKGTYQPASGSTYSLKAGISIYGGFAGNETISSQRNWVTNVTILKGNGIGVITNNAAGVVLDGFTITGGSANDGGGMYNSGASPILSNLIFSGNSATNGGAIYNANGSNPSLTNVVFTQNSSTGLGGGAMYNTASNPTLVNVLFYDNTTAGRGGGMYNNGSSPVLTNVVFSENNATGTGAGGGIFNNNTSNPTITNATFADNSAPVGGAMDNNNASTPIITNSVFWNNTATTGNVDFANTISGNITTYGSETVSYSYTQTAITGTGNIVGTVNPFVNDSNPKGTDNIFMTADDGLELTPCSPIINKGYTRANTTLHDIAGDPRLYNGAIDIGAYEYFGYPDGTSLASNQDETTQTIYPGTNGLMPAGSCRIIGLLAPDGTSPVAGAVSSRLIIDSAVLTYLGQPYVQRHIDITPAVNAATSTGTVTVFATQTEFDAFNAVSTVKLPTNPTDYANIANISIIQFHGTSVTGMPGTYSGNTVVITPNVSFIVWNYTLNRWEIRFPVNGFSGFVITATGGTVLSLNLLSFDGTLQNGQTQLQWQTADEKDLDHFEVEKSIDGKKFAAFTTIKAIGNGNNSYTTVDAQPQIGYNYYKLKSVNNDGSISYSEIIRIEVGKDGTASFVIYPNPTSSELVVDYANASKDATISIYSLSGQKVLTIPTNGQAKITIDVSHLSTGTYLIQYNSEVQTIRDKFIKIN
jgi:predicted outer membrane repeat protein